VSRSRTAAVLVVVGLLCIPTVLGACSSNHGTLSAPETPLARADQMLNSGEYEAAVAFYDQALETAPGSAVVLEKMATAKRMAAQVRAVRAVDAASKGNADEARGHLKKAEIYDASAPVVRRARAQLEDVLRAAAEAKSMKGDAKKVMARDPERARDLLANARQLDPLDREIVLLLREATLRCEAARAAQRAAAAWRAGQRTKAVRELSNAKFAGLPVMAADVIRAEIENDLLEETLPGKSAASTDVESLRKAREISVQIGLDGTAVRAIRKRLTGALQEEAARLMNDGRPAVAALLETECLRLGASISTPALDAIAERAQIRIAVAAFDDGTYGDVDGLRLARALATRLELDARGGGAAFSILPPSPDQERLLAAYPRALTLTGRATSARVAEGPRNTVVRRITLQEGVRIESNPALAVIKAEIRVLAGRRTAIKERADDAREELNRLNDIPFVRRPTGEFIGEGRASYELSLAHAESRVNNLRRREKSLAQQEAAARRRAATLPPRRETAIYGEYPLETLEFRKVAEVTVRLVLKEGDAILLDADVTGSAHHDEIVAPGLPEIDMAEDPDDTPDDAAMARAAADHFAVIAAGRIRHAAERAARRFLLDARQAEKSGRAAEAAEAYALYLLSTAEVSSPRRADAARALFDLAGVRVVVRTGVGELK